MRRAISMSRSGIYLAPPHEGLTTHFRTTVVGNVHMSFAWLGYGSLIPRKHILDFLELMQSLTMPDEEQKMADNYFSVFRNEPPEIWIATNPALTEIGGGQAFTAGQEGDDRNNHHIVGPNIERGSASDLGL